MKALTADQDIVDTCPCLVDEDFNCVLEYHYILAKLDQLGQLTLLTYLPVLLMPLGGNIH